MRKHEKYSITLVIKSVKKFKTSTSGKELKGVMVTCKGVIAGVGCDTEGHVTWNGLQRGDLVTMYNELPKQLYAFNYSCQHFYA